MPPEPFGTESIEDGGSTLACVLVLIALALLGVAIVAAVLG